MTRKVPIIYIKGNRNDSDFAKEEAQHKTQRLHLDNQQLTATVASLFKEMQHLKHQNNTMAQETEKLRKVLNDTKSYAICLKNRNDTLAADMDFQSSLHEKVSWSTPLSLRPISFPLFLWNRIFAA